MDCRGEGRKLPHVAAATLLNKWNSTDTENGMCGEDKGILENEPLRSTEDRKVKEGKAYLFAFVRFTTIDVALKTIAEMDNINLRGNNLSVKEADYKGDYGYHMGDHAELINTTGRVVKKVNGREFDPAQELVINIRCEDTVEENSILVSEEILNEWSFLSYNKNISVCAIVEKDLSIEHDKEGLQQRVRKVLENNMGQRKIKERTMTNKVKGLGNEDVKDGDEALDKKNDNDNVIEVVQVKELDKTKCREECVSNFDYEMGDYEDGQDLMAILKEQNEALDLKRRKAKQKEKACKSR
ncbi:hypothetical protein PIB30_075057 [Stylosanthes scabra]|uniref:RRM domain-containing protein n=1 Tax=Stylosanthes scabra TaxID=79078 RepID=A0ABU6XR07_9FABA|nr:hypothetical protein [Stylosanthes scabra]